MIASRSPYGIPRGAEPSGQFPSQRFSARLISSRHESSTTVTSLSAPAGGGHHRRLRGVHSPPRTLGRDPRVETPRTTRGHAPSTRRYERLRRNKCPRRRYRPDEPSRRTARTEARTPRTTRTEARTPRTTRTAGARRFTLMPQSQLNSSANLRTCVCGHPRYEHEHYRSGMDCAVCACTRFRWGWSPAGMIARIVATRHRPPHDT